jgi:serine protease
MAIEAVWDKFERRFPDSKHGWNAAGGMRVRLTGVGFFDRPHGQTGRARNQIEIHPVLDIEFLDDAVQPVAPGGATVDGVNILVNPGFEAGGDGWTVSGEGIMSADDSEPARTGQMKAWLGGHGEARTERISQAIAIPASASSATLTIHLHVTTEEQLNQVFDTLDVEITHPNGQVRQTLRRFTNLDAAEGYRIHAFDLTAFRGQDVRLRFTAREDNGSYTSFVLDDLALIVR